MKTKHILQTVLAGSFVLILSLCCWIHAPTAFSDSERRELAAFPELSAETLLSGKFMADFEDYTLDQFPLRDSWRTIKSLCAFYLFGQCDNNDIYIENGTAVKMEYPLNDSSIDYACEIFTSIYERYIKESNAAVYLSVIPDKNAFLGEQSGHLVMDYDAFYKQMQDGLPFAEYIDIMPLLSADDYYATDTHWKQEAVIDVAQTLADAMGTTLPSDYKAQTLDKPFYGVYYGQAALPLEPDSLSWLTNETMEAMTAYDHQNDREMTLYDMEKAYGKDPYEIFLSGSLSLITIDNPHATTDKELIVFRDSFGSSIAPLLAQGYQKVTLVDIRYLPSAMLDKYLTFDDRDVLFLYSTLVLNNSNTLK